MSRMVLRTVHHLVGCLQTTFLLVKKEKYVSFTILVFGVTNINIVPLLYHPQDVGCRLTS